MRPRVSSKGGGDYLPGDSGECPFSENLLSSLSVEGSAPRCPWTPRPPLCLLSVCIGLTRLPPSALFAEVPADQVPRSEVGRVQGVREGKQTHRQPAARALPAARWVSRASAPPGMPYGAGCRQPAPETRRNTHSPRSALPGSFPSGLFRKGVPQRTHLAARAAAEVLVYVTRVSFFSE